MEDEEVIGDAPDEQFDEVVREGAGGDGSVDAHATQVDATKVEVVEMEEVAPALIFRKDMTVAERRVGSTAARLSMEALGALAEVPTWALRAYAVVCALRQCRKRGRRAGGGAGGTSPFTRDLGRARGVRLHLAVAFGRVALRRLACD